MSYRADDLSAVLAMIALLLAASSARRRSKEACEFKQLQLRWNRTGRRKIAEVPAGK